MRICSNGHETEAGGKFCGECGEPLLEGAGTERLVRMYIHGQMHAEEIQEALSPTYVSGAEAEKIEGVLYEVSLVFQLSPEGRVTLYEVNDMLLV